MDTPRSLDAWTETIQSMVDRGARGSDEQLNDIIDYLHRTVTTINVNTADVQELQIVLSVPTSVAQEILKRREAHPFASIADLKSIKGLDPRFIDAKSNIIYFR